MALTAEQKVKLADAGPVLLLGERLHIIFGHLQYQLELVFPYPATPMVAQPSRRWIERV